jgi:plastocyanin
VSRNLTKLLLAASVAVGFTVAPMLGVNAASDRNVFVTNDQFQGGSIEGGVPTYDVFAGDKVIWHIDNGEHTVTPKDDPKYSKWPAGTEGSETLKEGDTFNLTFPTVGRFFFICEKHPDTMKGVIDVNDPNPTTTTTTTAPPQVSSTTTTAPPGPTTTTTSAPASSAGAKPPVGTPAPTTTTKPEKDKKGKDDKKKEEETTTTTAPPPPPPIDLPDSAIIPVLPGAVTETTTQNGIEAPGSTPEGDAIALLKSKGGGGDKAMKLLIISGLGLGVLGIGTAGYKYANRSSKYFPA